MWLYQSLPDRGPALHIRPHRKFLRRRSANCFCTTLHPFLVNNLLFLSVERSITHSSLLVNSYFPINLLTY